MSELAKLCQYIAELRFEDIPAEVVDYTKLLIADHYISAIAGHKYNSKFNLPLIEMINSDYSDGRSTALFQNRKLPASAAAYVNAVYCHGADIDDGHREAEAHPGVAVIASVLALSEEIGATGKETLLAVISGYEVFIRVAKSILPSHLWRGFHTTGTVGTIAAAAACAKLMNLNSFQIEKAISLSATQASGLLIVCESGQAAKPINPGNAARTGVMCAKLAQKDVDAPIDVFDSKKGFIHAFTDEYKPYALSDKLGEKYLIIETYVKLYPSCRHTHATLEAVKKYIKEYGHISEPKAIEVHTYPIAVDIVGHNTNPKTIGDVKFSIPYTCACAILNDNYSLSDLDNFEEQREKVIEFAKRIKVIAEEKYDDIPNGIRGSEIVVIDKNEKRRSAYIKIAKGEGDDRVTWQELKEKALSCAKDYSEEEIDNLLHFCLEIELLKNYYQPSL